MQKLDVGKSEIGMKQIRTIFSFPIISHFNGKQSFVSLENAIQQRIAIQQ